MSAIHKTATLMMTTTPHIKESEIEALQRQFWTTLCNLTISFLGWHRTNELLRPTPTCVQFFSKTDIRKNAQVAAAHTGDLSMLQSLARRDVDSNSTTKYFGEPLFAAVHSGRIEIVKFLLEAGANVNAQSGSRGTCLEIPSREGQIEMVQPLLTSAAKSHGFIECYPKVILAAVVRILKEAGSEAQFDEVGGDVLLEASYHGHDKIVQLALDAGVNINIQRGLKNYSAIYYASLRGHLQIVRLLLSKGSEVNPIATGYGSPLQAASWKGYTEIIQALLDNGANLAIGRVESRLRQALHLAAGRGFEGAVRLLVQYGAEINNLDRNSTVLAEAAGQGRVSTARVLLELGADPHVHNIGLSPLWTAAKAGCLELVKLFLELGLDINGPPGPWQPQTRPINIAKRSDHNCVVDLLLDLGANPACIDCPAFPWN